MRGAPSAVAGIVVPDPMRRSTARAPQALLVALIVTMPVTEVFEIGGKSANLAASDVLMPLAIAFLLWRAVKGKLMLPLFGLCCLTTFAVGASFTANFEETIAAKGIIGITVETIKIFTLWLQFYVAVNTIESAADFRLALRSWLFTSVGVALVGIYGSISYQMTGLENEYALMFRAQSTLGDSNLFASYLGLSLLLGLLLWQMERQLRRWIVPAIAIYLVAIFLSASRGAILSLTAVLLTLTALSMTWKARLLAAASVLAAAGAVATMPDRGEWLASNPFTERLATATVNVHDDAASDRKQLWDDAFARFESAPFLGVGRGNFRPLAEPDPTKTGYVHNTFLGIACETGILGVLAYALTFSRYALALGFDRLAARGRRYPLPTRIMLCALLIMMLSGLTISIENFRGLWILIGMMEAYRRLFGAYGFPRMQSCTD